MRTSRPAAGLVFFTALAILALVQPAAVIAQDGLTGAGKRVSLRSPPQERDLRRAGGPFGRYIVEVWRDDQWRHAGSILAGQNLRPAEVELSGLAPNVNVRVRIAKAAGGAAHVDSILLDGRPPVRAEGAPLYKLARADFDVSDAHHGPIEVEFAATAAGRATLQLMARIEAETIPTTPFQYPPGNTYRKMSERSLYYTYRLGSAHGRLTLDGELQGEGLGAPFFAEKLPVASGHPQGTTYGWVRDDGKTLFVAIDFTPDNTVDGDKDYTKVYALVDGTLRKFKLSDPERSWGRPGFTYTDKVAWQHKVYEFAIPFAALGVDPAAPPRELRLAFAAYGTGRPGGNYDPNVTYNSAANEFLAVMIRDAGSQVQDVRGRRLDPLGTPLVADFSLSPSRQTNFVELERPAVAHDPIGDRYLAVSQQRQLNRLVQIDPATGIGSAIGSVALDLDSLQVHSLALDTNTGTLYGVDQAGGDHLVTINRVSGAITPIGSGLGAGIAVQALAFDPGANKLYGVNTSPAPDELVTIHVGTGVATTVGSLGSPNAIGANTLLGMAFDPNTDMLYGVDRTTAPNRLLTIDTGTGAATVVGSTGSLGGSFNFVSALTLDPDPDGNPGTPDAILYAVETGTDELLTLNKTTGAATLIAKVGYGELSSQTFDPATDKLLSVNVSRTEYIAGQLADRAGTLLASGTLAALPADDFSGSFFISPSDGSSKERPAVAFDPVNRRYLVVWPDNRIGLNAGLVDIFGQLVSERGELLVPGSLAVASSPSAGTIVISTATDTQRRPEVAFDPASERYLIVWEDTRAANQQIFGQLVDGAGALVGPGAGDPAVNLRIAEDALGIVFQINPAVAVDPLNGRFLVAWNDQRNEADDIFAQLVDSNGNRLGAAGGAPDTDFPIHVLSPSTIPAVSFVPAPARFLVTWEDQRDIGTSGLDAFGQFVLTDGTLFDQDGNGTPDPAADDFLVSSGDPGITHQERLAGAGNVFCGTLATVYQDSGTLDTGQAVRGPGNPPTADCSPNRGLLWPSGVAPSATFAGGLIAPTSAASGTTATFQVDYFSVTETAPALATLEFDSDGDGLIAQPVVFSSMRALPGGGPRVPDAAAPAVALAVLLLGGLLLTRRKPPPAWAALSIVLGLGLASAIALIACNGSSSSAPSLAPASGIPGITVTPTSGLVTTEGGGTATFTVVLASQPSTDVSLGATSSDPGEGLSSPTSLTFTAANWSVPQTVTVTGVQDDLVDGDQSYSILTAAASSGDAAYNNLDASDVAVTNSDDDAAGITVTPTAGLATSEAGTTASFSVVLDSEPTGDVTIALSSSDTSEGTVSPITLTFTAANWSSAQMVTVTGVQDNVVDGDQPFAILTAAASSSDANFGGLNPPDVAASNTDSVFQELFAMVPLDGADATYADGRRYTVSVPIVGAERSVPFRFVFGDGGNVALGNPALFHGLAVTP